MLLSHLNNRKFPVKLWWINEDNTASLFIAKTTPSSAHITVFLRKLWKFRCLSVLYVRQTKKIIYPLFSMFYVGFGKVEGCCKTHKSLNFESWRRTDGHVATSYTTAHFSSKLPPLRPSCNWLRHSMRHYGKLRELESNFQAKTVRNKIIHREFNTLEHVLHIVTWIDVIMMSI